MDTFGKLRIRSNYVITEFGSNVVTYKKMILAIFYVFLNSGIGPNLSIFIRLVSPTVS